MVFNVYSTFSFVLCIIVSITFVIINRNLRSFRIYVFFWGYLSSKYINSIALSNQSNTIAQIITPAENTSISSETSSQPTVQAQANEQPAPAPVAAQRRNPEFQEPQGDREDDWLGILHNTVSFIILFSIIYFYSSFERFFVICVVVFFLFL